MKECKEELIEKNIYATDEENKCRVKSQAAISVESFGDIVKKFESLTITEDVNEVGNSR